VTPVDLALVSRGRFKPDKGLAVFGPVSFLAEIVFEDGDFAIKAGILKSLEDDGGRGLGVLFKELVDQVPVGVQFG
jgi:hypothetical protein